MDSKPGWNTGAVASFVIAITTIVITCVLNSIHTPYGCLGGGTLGTLISFLLILIVMGGPFVGLTISIIALASHRRGQRGMAMAFGGLLLNGLLLTYAMLPQCFDYHYSLSYLRRKSCATNLKQVGIALSAYEQDYDEHLPPRGIWNKAVYDFYKNKAPLVCPEDDCGKPTYAINRDVINSEVTEIDDPAGTIMLFECTPGINRVGGVEMARYRHYKGCNVGFADGHVKWLLEKDFRQSMNRKVETRKKAKK